MFAATSFERVEAMALHVISTTLELKSEYFEKVGPLIESITWSATIGMHSETGLGNEYLVVL